MADPQGRVKLTHGAKCACCGRAVVVGGTAFCEMKAVKKNKNQLVVQKRLIDTAIAMQELPQVECPVKHCFTDGLYSREMTIPKNTVIISKLHKTEHQFVMSKGRMLVWNEGEEVKEISAPFAGITKPGTMRMAVVLEEVIWTTFHATKLKDPEKIERKITIDPIKEQKCLSV